MGLKEHNRTYYVKITPSAIRMHYNFHLLHFLSCTWNKGDNMHAVLGLFDTESVTPRRKTCFGGTIHSKTWQSG